jgi:hypothetical protein
MTINQTLNRKGLRAMQGFSDIDQAVIQARMNDLQAEAAGERQAASGRTLAGSGLVRRRVGTILIHAGIRLAGGQASAGSSANRTSRHMAA